MPPIFDVSVTSTATSSDASSVQFVAASIVAIANPHLCERPLSRTQFSHLRVPAANRGPLPATFSTNQFRAVADQVGNVTIVFEVGNFGGTNPDGSSGSALWIMRVGADNSVVMDPTKLASVDNNDGYAFTLAMNPQGEGVLVWKRFYSAPEGSAHYIQGELIRMDHAERQLVIRVDRNDSQQRGVWDLPLSLDMLPYGSIYYHGAPAALCDIPLGTHLHTWCYLKDETDDRPPLAVFHDRISPEAAFRRCIRIEDDFSYRVQRQQVWKIDSVDLETKKLTVTLQHEGKAIGERKVFDLLGRTRDFQQHGFATLESLAKDQLVQFNLTWVGLFGPGRILDIYLDDESRNLATAQQMERHQLHIRERGLPAWVDAVDDKQQIVTMTFFDGVDPALFEELTDIHPEPLGWPAALFGKGGAKDDLAPKGTIAVARESLMTYDPTNDRKGGNIVKISKVPVVPGCSGVQIQLECGMLLEGFRPTKIVRFYPASWPFITVPMEESFHGRE